MVFLSSHPLSLLPSRENVERNNETRVHLQRANACLRSMGIADSIKHPLVSRLFQHFSQRYRFTDTRSRAIVDLANRKIAPHKLLPESSFARGGTRREGRKGDFPKLKGNVRRAQWDFRSGRVPRRTSEESESRRACPRGRQTEFMRGDRYKSIEARCNAPLWCERGVPPLRRE